MNGFVGWDRVWVFHCYSQPINDLENKWGGVWATSVSNKIIALFRLDDGVKINAENYCKVFYSFIVCFPNKIWNS